jgi:hypothetical protein
MDTKQNGPPPTAGRPREVQVATTATTLAPIVTDGTGKRQDGRAVERIREALEDFGSRVHGSAVRFRAVCPVHESHGSPTLAVSQGRSGALVKCHAQCETADILAALGLTMDDLFDQPRDRAASWRAWRRPPPDALDGLRRELGYAVHVMNLRYHEARTPKGPALSADDRLELAEWGEKQDQDAHYWRTLAKLAALATDEAYVREAYAQRAKWLRTRKREDKPGYQQDMTLLTRHEDLERAR